MEVEVRPYNDGHTHEALHTVYVTQDLFESHVLESMCAHEFADVRAEALAIADRLGRLYQLIGTKFKD